MTCFLFVSWTGGGNLALYIGVALGGAFVLLVLVAACIWWQTSSSSASMALGSAPAVMQTYPDFVFSKNPMSHTRYVPSQPPYFHHYYRDAYGYPSPPPPTNRHYF